MQIKTLSLFISFLMIIHVFSTDYDLVLLSQSDNEACLDGSPPGIYVHQGSGENTNKFLIYFEGGGFCGDDSTAATLQSCYRRSSTSLGTTKVYQKHHNFDKDGILSTEKSENKNFYDWTKIYVIYCDGSTHIGYRENPISYKDKKLYFRGAKNSIGVFKYLDQKYDFYNKDTIVITGISAGGLGVYEWMNYLHDNTKTSKVLAIPDSGIFLTEYVSPTLGYSIIEKRTNNLFSLVGVDPQGVPEPIQKCLLKGSSIPYCSNPGHYAQYLKPPMLIINSPYDQWALDNIIIAKCLTNRRPPYSISSCNDTMRAAIEDYRNKSIQIFQSIKKGREDVSFWGPACVQHGYSLNSLNSNNFLAPDGNGQTLDEAIRKFLDNPTKSEWLLDYEEWPNNKGCSGVSSFNLRQILDI